MVIVSESSSPAALRFRSFAEDTVADWICGALKLLRDQMYVIRNAWEIRDVAIRLAIVEARGRFLAGLKCSFERLPLLFFWQRYRNCVWKFLFRSRVDL